MERCETRKTDFADNLRKTARDRGLQLSQTFGFAFRRRYNLPPTDPRWLNATIEDVYLDVWAHAHVDNPKLRDEIFSTNFEEDYAEMEREALAMEAAQDAADRAKAEKMAPDDWEEVASDTWKLPISGMRVR